MSEYMNLHKCQSKSLQNIAINYREKRPPFSTHVSPFRLLKGELNPVSPSG